MYRSQTSESGLIEADKAYTAKWGISINSNTLPLFGQLWVSDASTPEPNFRATEAFMAMLSMAHSGPFVSVCTFICAGGTHRENGLTWKLHPSKEKLWMDFYEGTGIMDRIPAILAPIGNGIFKAAALRKRTLTNMWRSIAPFIRITKAPMFGTLHVHVLEEKFGSSMLSELLQAIPLNGIILKFPCPSCSYQHKTPIYHAVRRAGSSIVVTKDQSSPGEVGCKAAIVWKSRWDTLSLREAGIHLGARISGKALYYVMSRSKPNLLIRDYSSARGTLSDVVKMWGKNLWISRRTYLPENRTGFDLAEAMSRHPERWAKVLTEFPLLADGASHHIGM